MRNEHTENGMTIRGGSWPGVSFVVSGGSAAAHAGRFLGTVVVMAVPPPVLRVEIDREDDDRWIADVVDVPGAMAYGATREDAIREAQALALDVLADELRHHEREPGSIPLFQIVP